MFVEDNNFLGTLTSTNITNGVVHHCWVNVSSKLQDLVSVPMHQFKLEQMQVVMETFAIIGNMSLAKLENSVLTRTKSAKVSLFAGIVVMLNIAKKMMSILVLHMIQKTIRNVLVFFHLAMFNVSIQKRILTMKSLTATADKMKHLQKNQRL